MSVAWFTSLLYPGKATGDLRAEVHDFYKLFYHVDITDEQIDTLLADASARP
ncbi:hypothetical protein [Mesorhizobium sp. M0019]|uniref:hypothetical protein n=1 Tax=Mesorhizobium sp. M0019 TaxID=2956845 RepID=UPI003339B3B3